MNKIIEVTGVPGGPFHLPHNYCNYRFNPTGGCAGSQGVIKKFDGPNGSEIAVKKFTMPFHTKARASLVLRELNLLKNMNHPNVVRLLDMYTVEGSAEEIKSVYHITEYCGHDLSAVIEKGNYSMDHVKRWTKELLDALSYINSLGITHRNLKPKNLCISEKTGKLTLLGFGRGRVLAAQGNTGARGTEPYMAIEMQVEWKEGDYDEKVDIWSMAVILCELLSGVVLFLGPDVKNVLKRMIQFCGPVEEELLSKMTSVSERTPVKQVSAAVTRVDFIDLIKSRINGQRGISANDIAKEKHLKDFIDKTLQFNPKFRMSAHRALSHPFLTGIDGPCEIHLPKPGEEGIAECKQHVWDLIQSRSSQNSQLTLL